MLREHGCSLLAIVAAVSGCGTDRAGRDGFREHAPGEIGAAAGVAAGPLPGIDRGPSTNGAPPAVVEPDAGPPPAPPAAVYGHSSDELYKLDPVTKAVTVIGAFSGCATAVIDIALDESSNLYGTTESLPPDYDYFTPGTPGAIYRIDRNTAKCTFVASGDFPNSLSFVPKGTLDPNVEALVGFLGSTYVRIDPGSGSITAVGDLDRPGYESSGDVVSVKGAGTYLTVRGDGCDDCIVEIDPKTGKLLTKLTGLPHSSVFGLAYWGGAAYGFDDAGDLFEIDLLNGGSTTPITIPNAPSGLSFWGAGSTTSAPIAPPPKPPPPPPPPPPSTPH
jgi:hypothetical protein